MICPKCSQPVSAGAHFCGRCGSELGLTASTSGTAASADFASLPNIPAAVNGPGPGPGPGPGAAAALPGLLARIRGILLSPRTEWPLIERESTSIAQLYSGYAVPLAAFAAVVSLLRMSVIGISMPFGGTVRTPLASASVYAAMTFVAGLVGLLLIALVINTLAPTFSGQRNLRQALKTAAYACTPAWIGTALAFLPLASLLQLLAALYGIYVLYLGLPVLMRSRPERAGSYTAAVVVCTIVLGLLLGALSASLGGASPLAGLRGAGGGTLASAVAPNTDSGSGDQGAAALGNIIGGALGTDAKGKAGLTTALANLDRAGRQMQADSSNTAAAKTAAATGRAAGQTGGSSGTAGATEASQSGATDNALAAAGGLLGALGGALGGSHRVNPVDYNTLKSLLPASLPQMSRTSAEGSSKQAMGVRSTSATADYAGPGSSHVQIRIADISGVSGLLDAAGGLVPAESHESDTGYEKDAMLNGRPVHEKYDGPSRQGSVEAIVAKRFDVEITSQGVDMRDLERILTDVDLAKLESMRDVGAIAN
jgi:energy-converting hydrogenase Eha subunit A